MGKIIGVIPVRMGSSRFPGKPLFQIAGMSMLEHVWHRAKMYHDWDELFLATCDDEIKELFLNSNLEVTSGAITGGRHRMYAMIGRIASGKKYIPCSVSLR